MKFLFVSCLALLFVLCEAQAQENTDMPKDLESLIIKSKIPNKSEFINELLTQANLNKICPRILFSLGIEKWEKLSPSKYSEVIKDLAQLAPYLKDSSGPNLRTYLK